MCVVIWYAIREGYAPNKCRFVCLLRWIGGAIGEGCERRSDLGFISRHCNAVAVVNRG